MKPDDAGAHHWPEEEPDAPHTERAKRGKLARLGRALGDSALTVGMSQGLVGGVAGDGNRAMNNAMLIEQGKDRDTD